MSLMKLLFLEDRNQDVLDSIREFSSIKRTLLFNKFKLIGHGTTRDVYSIPGDELVVLKVPRYPDAFEVNLSEVKNFSCLGEGYAARIVDSDKINGLWLKMERVKTFKYSDSFDSEVSKNLGFEFSREGMVKKFGLDPDSIARFPLLSDAFAPSKDYDKAINLRELLCKNSLWFREFNSRLVDCDIYAEDLDFKNFGLRMNTGELVLLDYGFSASKDSTLGVQSKC
jgi:hypothetical protein